MYTRCPHCTTIFRITAEQLRTAHDDILCVTCKEPFNALESLSDDITTLIAPPDANKPDNETESDDPDDSSPAISADDSDAEPDETQAETGEYKKIVDPDAAADEDEEQNLMEPDAPQTDGEIDDGIEPETPFRDDDCDSSADEQPAESMEFDAPEQTWTRFFLTNDAIAALGNAEHEPGLDADPGVAAPEPEFGPGLDSGVGQPWISTADNELADTGSLEFQTADQDEWQRFLAELGDDDSSTTSQDAREIPFNLNEDISSDIPETAIERVPEDEFARGEGRSETEAPILPPWLADEISDDAPEQLPDFRLSWQLLGTCATLILFLAGQLIHYNRDALATSATYGAAIRGIYSLFDASLYPDWPLDAFEVTGTEAITGRSNQNALDILANVVVNGRQPIGLPLIRVVLNDRWSNPVASRVFEPTEYLPDFGAAELLVTPGTALPVQISVTDPGAEALGYVVDVCLPRRKSGLECQIAKDPFK